ncbi:MAG TPA: hypothetical protein VJP80_07130 [Candidatus Saccharimonadales bacterium]|nr:hypothetical protein [Candidatus Saccharimonadales bacterium]
MNIISSAFGHYEIIGNPAQADVIVAHSFGTCTDAFSANAALAHFAVHYAEDANILAIVADRTLANAFPRDTHVEAIDGVISTATGKGLGTWGTWVKAKEFMDREGLHTPLVVAQACHVGRVARQGYKAGITELVVPEGLPCQFDGKKTKQRWTRSLGWWVPREVVGSFVLRAKGHL